MRDFKWWHWALFGGALLLLGMTFFRAAGPAADLPEVAPNIGQPKGAPRTPEEIAEIEATRQAIEEMKAGKR
ncbi:hypothetical protein EON81_12505 [bacterium]|nr:MAG: hypothetical protein EON81_12505 [bacterium]